MFGSTDFKIQDNNQLESNGYICIETIFQNTMKSDPIKKVYTLNKILSIIIRLTILHKKFYHF